MYSWSVYNHIAIYKPASNQGTKCQGKYTTKVIHSGYKPPYHILCIFCIIIIYLTSLHRQHHCVLSDTHALQLWQTLSFSVSACVLHVCVSLFMCFCVYIVQEPNTDQKEEITGRMGKVGKEECKKAMEVAVKLLSRQLWPSSTSAQGPIFDQSETVTGEANKATEEKWKGSTGDVDVRVVL